MKTICCIIPLDNGREMQAFHPKYLNGKGGNSKLFIDFATKAHKQITVLRKCLTNFKQCFENEDKDTLKFIQNFLAEKHERIIKIKIVLKQLEDGTFSFNCLKTNCKRHINCGGKCSADLTAEKFAMPEIATCTKVRAKQEENMQRKMNA